VKEFWKSVKNLQSYRHEFGVLLFLGTRCNYVTTCTCVEWLHGATLLATSATLVVGLTSWRFKPLRCCSATVSDYAEFAAIELSRFHLNLCVLATTVLYNVGIKRERKRN